MVTVEVATHYFERLRDTIDKDDVKKNVERSLAELMALQNKGANKFQCLLSKNRRDQRAMDHDLNYGHVSSRHRLFWTEWHGNF
jgi:hypothetical protein